MSRKAIHVVPQGKQWAVKTEGASRAAKVTDTQGAAIEKARHMAIDQKAELIVHREDGRIRSKDSFGPDPCPPKDKEH